MADIYYIDLDSGSDAASGVDWANAWKTITNGATAARILPSDTIRISKTPDPVSIGNGTWTDLSKTVTLASAQTLTIDLCESVWTANGSGDCTPSTDIDEKQGSTSMKLLLDASVQTATMQAYFQIS